ncbi:YheC/YheD family endospore coat-associated protein [Paenibacillus silvisoli]|uniref:YheC/YheD family endospore coat-associated protein n=1 Tax=Paenibacillus silvisoli TaxID=3110539 RepID=UPI0028054FC1|nr:YheC/YheD family protein [Paenibacillus silvisoli]
MYINWIPELRPNQIRLPKSVAIPHSVVLHFGSWKKKMSVIICDHLSMDSIGLPEHLKTEITIPDTLPYEMYVDGANLHLGPVIAFLIPTQMLTSGVFNDYLKYFANYQTVKGLIYLCSVNGINPTDKTIEGFYYNPNADGSDAPWTKGIFPYPGAAYRRIWVGSRNRLYDDLIVHMKGKIFNPYFLNKWELCKLLCSKPLIRDHLPVTKRVDNLQTLEKMLALYTSVYLKPANGSMGQGIMKVEKTPKGYLFINRYQEKTFFASKTKAWAYFRRIRKGRKYLIQQSAALTYQNKNVDFRVIMQKDGNQQWACSGVIARYGEVGRFYTNDISSISLGRDALRTVFHFNDEEAAQKEEEIISICTKACQLIDHKYGPFGDVGIDVTVDTNLKVWLLEINSLHQHTIPYYVKDDPQMYSRVLSRPFEYAKSLAGFTKEKIL